MANLFKLRFLYALTTCILITLSTSLSYAEKRYIVDVIVVSLREGPTGSFRSIKTLKTGNSFTVLDEQDKFIKVETNDGTTGWLPKQYTSLNPPKKVLLDTLSNKLKRITQEKEKLNSKAKYLKEELALKEHKINEVEKRYSLVKKTENTNLISLQQQLDTITQKHDTLVEQSKTTIRTSKERDSLKSSNTTLKSKIGTLEKENTRLANKQALYWFLAGSGVFILGWLVGRISFRRQKSSLTL